MPARSIVARWLLPALVIGAALSALAVAGFEAIRPAVAVHVAPVVARDAALVPVLLEPDASIDRVLDDRDDRDGGTDRGDSGHANARSAHAEPGSANARWVQAPGWIEPDPQPVVASALRDGIIEQVLVLEGDRVKRGDAVARLESDSTRLMLAHAAADLARAEAQRERSLAMAEEARAEEAQLPFRRAAAQARLDAARDASERADRLAQTNAMGEAEVVRYRSVMLEAQADLEAIEPRSRAISAAIRAAEAEARSATLVPQAMVDHARLDHDRSTVLAPIDGVVMEVHALPGQNLFAGDMALGRAVVTLYDPRRLRVRADVPLADAAGLAVGQRARVTVEVLPDRVFEGVVTRLVHKADIQKNTVGVKVSITDPSPELKPDMLARVRIEVVSARDSGALSAPAAQRGDDGARNLASATSGRHLRLARADALAGEGPERRAFVVVGFDRGRGRVEARRVRVDERSPHDGWISVSEGLAVGDRVVLAPPSSLIDGTAVVVAGMFTDGTEVADGAR